MFYEIRNRLTKLYTGVMAIFVVAFIATSDAGVLWALHGEEKQDILSFAEEEAKETLPKLMQNEMNLAYKADSSDTKDGKIFSYAFDNRGQLVDVQKPAAKMRPQVEEMIREWQEIDGEGRIKKFLLPGGERVVAIMCSLPIKDQEEVLGRIYVGEDITSYYGLLKNLLLVWVVIALVFLIMAAFAGHLLAGRAIVPIKQSFARQRRFVADASHELRTPLSILMTSVEAVQTDKENELTAFSVEVLADMKSEVRRMTKIVADLLTLARADARVNNIMKENFDVAVLIEQTGRYFQPIAAEKGIMLNWKSEKGGIAFADRERISQLLLILVDNAIKYTPAGGVVEVSAKLISGVETGTAIIVEDTGIGIPDTYKNLIFDRFYRVDKVRSRKENGNGLGLSIAKWIVDAHGGTIHVENSPSGGSKFTVRLLS